MEPQKIQERDWIAGGPSTAQGKPRKQLNSLEDSLLVPETKKLDGGMTRTSGQLLVEPALPLHPQGFIFFLLNKSCHSSEKSPMCVP